jgi:phage shock protein PspC (stress-responsive transcriptional regulator)
MLFGVAGGMAEWMDLDPAIVRLVWALLILAGGVGLLLYIIAAIVIPEAPSDLTPASGLGATTEGSASAPASEPTRREARRARRAARRGSGNPGMVFGLILVIVGAWFLLRQYLPSLDLGWVMPGALIVIGLVLVVGALNRSGSSEG